MTNYSLKNKNLSQGFTLMELIIAMGLGVTLSVLLMTTLSSGLGHIRSIKHAERLQENSATTISNISYLIKTGDTITVPEPSTMIVEYKDSPAEAVHISENRILVNDTPITTNSIKVKSAEFTDHGRSVEFRITMEAGDKTLTINETTTKRQSL